MATDAERLDFLEANDGLLNFADRGPHVCLPGPEYVHFYGKSYRDAIDTAMRDYTPPEIKPEQAPFIKQSFRNAEGPMLFMSDDTTWVYKRSPQSMGKLAFFTD